MTDIVEQAARVMAGGQEYADGYMNLAQALADAGLLTDGTNYAALVKEAQRSGCAVEIDGVRIHPCDTYGNDTTKPTRTVPTRDEIAEAVGGAANPTQVGIGVVSITQATDAILELLDGQPTITEAKAQAWEEAADYWENETHQKIVPTWLRERAQQIRDGK